MAEVDSPSGTSAKGSARGPDGASAAAILLMLLNESDAAAVVRDLNPDEVRILAKAMFAAAEADEQLVERALDQFVRHSRSVSALAVGADARIRSVMNEALGNVRADNLLATLAPQNSAASLEMLRWMDVEQIGEILAHEHPQVSALILSVLVPDVAVAAIAPLSEARQTDLMLRAAQLESVSATAIEDLEAVLKSANAAVKPGPRQPVGGPGEVAKIIKQMPKPLSEKAIQALRKQDKLLARSIEEQMFVFDNLRDLNARTLGTVLRGVDAKTLGMALKGADEAMIDMCLATMSQRAAETIRDEMADLTMVKRADVEEAQRSIMQIVRQMAAAGEITMSGGGEDYV